MISQGSIHINATPTSSIKLVGSLDGVESFTSKITKSLALGLLMLMSVSGNSLVITCVIRNVNKRMRTVSNLLIVNTSIAYLLIAVINVPELIFAINVSDNISIFGGTLGLHVCRMKIFVPFLSVTLSTQSFGILAVDRFIAVFYPFRRISHKLAYIFIIVTWFNSFVFGGVYLYGSFTAVHPDTGNIVCFMQVDRTFHGIQGLVTFVWIEFAVFYVFPLFTAGVLYTATILRLWKPKILRTTARPGHFVIRYSDTTNKNAIKMLVTVFVLFAVAWLPLWIYTAICRGNPKAFLKHPICRSRVFVFLKYFIGYFHGAIAPFVYPIFSQNFREGFKACLPCLSFLWTQESVAINVAHNTSPLELKSLSSNTKETSKVTALSINWTGSPNIY